MANDQNKPKLSSMDEKVGGGKPTLSPLPKDLRSPYDDKKK